MALVQFMWPVCMASCLSVWVVILQKYVTVPEAPADAKSNTCQFKTAYTREVTKTRAASSSRHLFRPRTHYPYVTWAHVMLRVGLGCERRFNMNSVAQIHTSFTLLTSRDLAWSSGRLTCQHGSQIFAAAHISWDVTYVSSALQTLPVVSRNGGNGYWKSAPTDLCIWHQVTRL